MKHLLKNFCLVTTLTIFSIPAYADPVLHEPTMLEINVGKTVVRESPISPGIYLKIFWSSLGCEPPECQQQMMGEGFEANDGFLVFRLDGQITDDTQRILPRIKSSFTIAEINGKENNFAYKALLGKILGERALDLKNQGTLSLQLIGVGMGFQSNLVSGTYPDDGNLIVWANLTLAALGARIAKLDSKFQAGWHSGSLTAEAGIRIKPSKNLAIQLMAEATGAHSWLTPQGTVFDTGASVSASVTAYNFYQLILSTGVTGLCLDENDKMNCESIHYGQVGLGVRY